MGVLIGTIGLVFGAIFKSPMRDFLPFLAAGMILWGLISSVILEGCTAFIAAEGIIKQLPIPLNVHILRVVWRNLIIFAHNLIIFPLVILVVQRPIDLVAFVCIPGLILIVVNLMWIALLLAVVCARYRDLPQIVGSLLQIIYFVTPIMWLPYTLPDQAKIYLLNYNPFFHLIELFRAPLLGDYPTYTNWTYAAIMACVGWTCLLLVYGRYKVRVAYWI